MLPTAAHNTKITIKSFIFRSSRSLRGSELLWWSSAKCWSFYTYVVWFYSRSICLFDEGKSAKTFWTAIVDKKYTNTTRRLVRILFYVELMKISTVHTLWCKLKQRPDHENPTCSYVRIAKGDGRLHWMLKIDSWFFGLCKNFQKGLQIIVYDQNPNPKIVHAHQRNSLLCYIKRVEQYEKIWLKAATRFYLDTKVPNR